MLENFGRRVHAGIEHAEHQTKQIIVATEGEFLTLIQRLGGTDVNASLSLRTSSEKPIGRELVAQYVCKTPEGEITLDQPYATVTRHQLHFLEDIGRLILQGLVKADYLLEKMRQVSPHLNFRLTGLDGVDLNENDREQIRTQGEIFRFNPIEA